MNKQKAVLPELVDEIDALRLENLVMKLSVAQAQLQQMGAQYNEAFEAAARKYKFDAKVDAVDFATRKIVRQ